MCEVGTMVQTKEMIEHYGESLQNFIDCIKVGIYIADGEGKTIMLNSASENTGGKSREELVGKYMEELIEDGYIQESSIIKVLASNREENIIQKLEDGDELFITGVPLLENEKIQLVVCTERDITETINLKELLKEKEKIAKKYKRELEYLRRKNLIGAGEIVTCCDIMKHVIENALRVANLDTTVLLTGESGTGKELIANLIYKNSHRVNKPFIKINCAAIPENLLESEFFGYEKGAFTGAEKQGKVGLFELANGGTLFLDEVAELTLLMQSKLLRVLQERELMRLGGSKNIKIDVRIISATNVNLKKNVEIGKFREDLYYRLNIIPLEIPPLRERKDDIEEISRHFLNHFNKEYTLERELTPKAISILKTYPWPGNVRELRNVIERIVISVENDRIVDVDMHKVLYADVYMPSFGEHEQGTLEKMLNHYERHIIESLMQKHENASKVAKILSVNKSTISRKLKKYGTERK